MGVEKKVYSFRFEESMVEELQVFAKRENRSLSNLVETVLKNYISYQKEHPEAVAALQSHRYFK